MEGFYDLKWELKCIPGSEQKCSDLRGYDNGEMNVCTPIGCPDGYHAIYVTIKIRDFRFRFHSD
jgi:hypothetical protein